jgi:hypothetical protein
MSSLLWRYYLEDDVDRFSRLLATAAFGPRPTAQKGNVGGTGGIAATTPGSPSSGIGLGIAMSPKATAKGKRSPALHGGGGGGGGAGKSGVVLTKADINSRDSSGLTILHRAASSTAENAVAFAMVLVEHPLVDLYVQDLESGWTVLHRALYFGNITMCENSYTYE